MNGSPMSDNRVAFGRRGERRESPSVSSWSITCAMQRVEHPAFQAGPSGFEPRAQDVGPVDVSGVVAALSRRKSRVRIPPGLQRSQWAFTVLGKRQ